MTQVDLTGRPVKEEQPMSGPYVYDYLRDNNATCGHHSISRFDSFRDRSDLITLVTSTRIGRVYMSSCDNYPPVSPFSKIPRKPRSNFF